MMVRMMGKIKPAVTALAVKKLSKVPGMHAVGGVPGLYLSVSTNPKSTSSIPTSSIPTLGTSWIYRYSFSGRRRDMGLGSLSDFSWEDARYKASNYRKQVLQGIDPLDEKHLQQDAQKKSLIKRVTFQHCIDSYLDAHGDAWKNAKH